MSPTITPDVTVTYAAQPGLWIALPSQDLVQQAVALIAEQCGASPQDAQTLLDVVEQLSSDASKSWVWGSYKAEQAHERGITGLEWAEGLELSCSRETGGKVHLHASRSGVTLDRLRLCERLGIPGEEPWFHATIGVGYKVPGSEEELPELEIPLGPLWQVLTKLFSEPCVVDTSSLDEDERYRGIEGPKGLARALSQAVTDKYIIAVGDDPEFYEPRHPLMRNNQVGLELVLTEDGISGYAPWAEASWDGLILSYPSAGQEAWLELTISAPYPGEASNNAAFVALAEQVRGWLEAAYAEYHATA